MHNCKRTKSSHCQKNIQGWQSSAYYPSLKASYTGVVSDMDPDSGEIAVEFDPTEDEPEGSSATFKKPYSFLKKL